MAGRQRIVDAEEIAANYRAAFYAKEPTEQYEYPWVWPRRMQNVGDSLAVAYASDKWRDDKQLILYKHLAESRNRALVVPGLLRDAHGKPIDVIGPMVELTRAPMPEHFAVLAPLEEVDLCLHVGGTNKNPRFGKHEDDGVVKVTIGYALVGASKIRWSLDGGEDQPMLLVYTEKDGPLMIIVGDELDVEADGIVG